MNQAGRQQLELMPVSVATPTPRVLDQRARGTSFLALPVRSVLNGPTTTGMGFWSLNPYVGCEFGCSYCYARDTHRYVVERATGGLTADLGAGSEIRAPAVLDDFERRILVKTEVAEVLTRSLDPAKLAGQTLVIGTATDPYQPAERRFRLTRHVLEALLRYEGLSIGLITKSPLITRDIDVLQRLSRRHDVSVNISLASLDAPLLRRLEPRTPVPGARIRALRQLTASGIYAGLLIAPIIPGLTDGRPALERLMRAAKEAGARYAVGAALRLNPPARHRFLPVLDHEFPELADRYRRHYARSDNSSRTYQQALSRRLHELQRAIGFSVDDGMRRQEQLEGHRPPEAPRTLSAEQPALL